MDGCKKMSLETSHHGTSAAEYGAEIVEETKPVSSKDAKEESKFEFK